MKKYHVPQVLKTIKNIFGSVSKENLAKYKTHLEEEMQLLSEPERIYHLNHIKAINSKLL